MSEEIRKRIINGEGERKLKWTRKYLQPSAGKVVGGMEPRCEPAGAFEGGGR